jgi:hypothetical protein
MEQESPSSAEHRGLGCWQQSALCCALLAIVTLIALPFVKAALRANDSEYKLHALICVSHVIEEFMKSHDGAWPSSWEDMTQTHVEQMPSMYHWPEDAEKVQECVEIDFDVGEAQLADPDFKVTSVIRVRGDYGYDPATRLATLQEYFDDRRSSQTTKPPPTDDDGC